MKATIGAALAAGGLAAACLLASQGAAGQGQSQPSREVAQPTGAAGATAFQPGGAAKAEAETGTGAQNGSAGMQQQAKPGFDNKPPAGAKANCARPQGGVDASGGENVNSSSKDNTDCTGKANKNGKADKNDKANKQSR